MTVTDQMHFDIKSLGARANAMIEALSVISDDQGALTRHYLSPSHRRAVDLVVSWMRDAGLQTHVDAAGTVHGLQGDGHRRRLLVGSHLDTVVNAGRFDGALGIVAGIVAADELRRRRVALPFDVEILAFGDEEGGRFPATLTGSSALAGQLEPTELACRDAAGQSMAEALRAFGGDPDAILDMAYGRGSVLGYLEVHIEQGPVLEAINRPLGNVTAIAGQTRFTVRVVGEAGHAGTVPMALRRDALAAAAEMVALVEGETRRFSAASLVATVGRIDALPGASNVIPGEASFTVDLRSATDSSRRQAFDGMRTGFESIAERRGVSVRLDISMDTPVARCSQQLLGVIDEALVAVGIDDPPRLMSGAGHDGHAMAQLTDIGMIFVRCEGGVSHHPREFVLPDDMGLAVVALVETVARLARIHA